MQRAHTHKHDALTHALTRSHTGDGTRGCVAHTHTDMTDVTVHRWPMLLVLYTVRMTMSHAEHGVDGRHGHGLGGAGHGRAGVGAEAWSRSWVEHGGRRGLPGAERDCGGCTSRQSQHHTCAEATRTDVSVQRRCGGVQDGSDRTRTESGEVMVRVHGPVVRSSGQQAD